MKSTRSQTAPTALLVGRFYGTSRHKRSGRFGPIAQVLRRLGHALDVLKDLRQGQYSSVHGNICIHLKIPVSDIVHVGVLPPVKLPRDIEEVGLDEQFISRDIRK